MKKLFFIFPFICLMACNKLSTDNVEPVPTDVPEYSIAIVNENGETVRTRAGDVVTIYSDVEREFTAILYRNGVAVDDFTNFSWTCSPNIIVGSKSGKKVTLKSSTACDVTLTAKASSLPDVSSTTTVEKAKSVEVVDKNTTLSFTLYNSKSLPCGFSIALMKNGKTLGWASFPNGYPATSEMKVEWCEPGADYQIEVTRIYGSVSCSLMNYTGTGLLNPGFIPFSGTSRFTITVSGSKLGLTSAGKNSCKLYLEAKN